MIEKNYCTKSNTSVHEEYSKAMGEIIIRNSAKCVCTFARKTPEHKFRIIESGIGTVY